EYYSIGISHEKIEDKFNFLIASPEKALCDKIVFTKKLHLNNIQSMQKFLFEDLRIDLHHIKSLNFSIIEDCISLNFKQKELILLLETLKKTT
ncbi:MAG: hypothetical protein COZ21_01345, partial [Bacteroidetes bacterium CG_4_10_14_3_um_filter_31_20]